MLLCICIQICVVTSASACSKIVPTGWAVLARPCQCGCSLETSRSERRRQMGRCTRLIVTKCDGMKTHAGKLAAQPNATTSQHAWRTEEQMPWLAENCRDVPSPTEASQLASSPWHWAVPAARGQVIQRSSRERWSFRFQHPLSCL